MPVSRSKGEIAEHPQPRPRGRRCRQLQSRSGRFPPTSRRRLRCGQGRQADRGLLVCGTGVGASIAANKIRGIRAAVCHDMHSAHQSVEHDDVNVMCIGAQIVGPWLAATWSAPSSRRGSIPPRTSSAGSPSCMPWKTRHRRGRDDETGTPQGDRRGSSALARWAARW